MNKTWHWSKFKSFINVAGDSGDSTDFPHNSLSTGAQLLRLCKVFANNSWANIKFSKTQLSKLV